ncbi:hypothetical protein TgHK011_005052 [Trichoderma gracile]|nr:hypothetical protein TgHK011_005052 [Trichoderma gracile]
MAEDSKFEGSAGETRAGQAQVKQEAAKGGRERGSRSSADASYMYFCALQLATLEYRPSPVVRPPGSSAVLVPGVWGLWGPVTGGAYRGSSGRTSTGTSTATGRCSNSARGPPPSQGQAQVPLLEPSLPSSESVPGPPESCPPASTFFPADSKNAPSPWDPPRGQELESIPAAEPEVVRRSVNQASTNRLTWPYLFIEKRLEAQQMQMQVQMQRYRACRHQ